MEERLSPSQAEAQFGQWMAEHGADLPRFWAGYHTISAAEVLVSLYSDALRELGITRDEWRILTMLKLAPGSEPRRLADWLWLGRSTVVNAVTRLERRGLVLREPAANDRRLVLLYITPAGEELAEQAAGVQATTLNGLKWGLSADETELLTKLTRRFWFDNFRRLQKTHESSPRVADAQG